jgi:hypothetical protein
MIKPRKKHPHRSDKDPLERIANALERIADAQETRSMSQRSLNQGLEKMISRVTREMPAIFGSYLPEELRGTGEIQIPQPPPKSR